MGDLKAAMDLFLNRPVPAIFMEADSAETAVPERPHCGAGSAVGTCAARQGLARELSKCAEITRNFVLNGKPSNAREAVCARQQFDEKKAEIDALASRPPRDPLPKETRCLR